MSQGERIRIDLNTADVQALHQVPGIGPTLAQRIVDARPFARPREITRVSGIGPRTSERLTPYFEVAAAPAEASPAGEAIEAKAPTAARTVEEPGLGEEQVAEPDLIIEPPDEEHAAEPELVIELSDEQHVAEPDLVIEPPDEEHAAEPDLVIEPPDEEHVAETDLVIEPADEELGDERSGAEGVVAAEILSPEPEETPIAAPAEAEQAPEEPQPEVAARRPAVRRRWVVWAVVLGSLATLILSSALSLGIVAGMNGGRLQFASPADVARVRVRVDGLEAQANDLRQDIAGLRERLDSLEALSGRVSALEGTTEALREDVDAADAELERVSGQVSDLGDDLSALSGQVDQLDDQVGALQTQLEEVQGQVERFQSFFAGLRELLETLFGTEGGGS